MVQASDNRLFDKQNQWIIVDSRLTTKRAANTAEVAARTFEKYLDGAYVLPESNVFVLVATDNAGTGRAWDVWEGFKISKTERIRVYRHGTVMGDMRAQFDSNRSMAVRTDLLGVTLKATTVVRFEPRLGKRRFCLTLEGSNRRHRTSTEKIQFTEFYAVIVANR